MRSAIATAVLFAAGCGDAREPTALEGVYQLVSWTHNPDGCEEEGPADPKQDMYSHFVIRDFYDDHGAINFIPCETIESCRAEAHEDQDLVDSYYSFNDGSEEDGWHHRYYELYYGDPCDGLVFDDFLTGEPRASARIEEETRMVSEIPPVGDDECDRDAAFEQADSLPCDQQTVIQGTYVEPL